MEDEELDYAINLGFNFFCYEYWFEQGACVQNVLDSVIASLLDDENRKFIYVEMVRFLRYIPNWEVLFFLVFFLYC